MSKSQWSLFKKKKNVAKSLKVFLFFIIISFFYNSAVISRLLVAAELL